jgi:hypothetical protein
MHDGSPLVEMEQLLLVYLHRKIGPNIECAAKNSTDYYIYYYTE